MGPAKPLTYTAGANPVEKFERAFIVTKHPAPPGRAFNFHVVIDTRHPRLLALEAEGKKPPTHFHPRQFEYFKVDHGVLTVEIDGVPRNFVPSDGEFELPPGPHHRLYASCGQEADRVEFWIGASDPSAEKGGALLDLAFFENWYGYQEDIMLRGVTPDPIQVACMFDAGDTYLSPPSWVPFRKSLGRALGVIVGRYIGGMLGYRPFFPEWTTDWDIACDQMEKCWATRRFADRGAQQRVKAEYERRGLPTGPVKEERIDEKMQ